MIQSISRTGTFDAAHRLMDHGGKCRNIHGHTYHWELTLHLVDANTPETIAIDFGDLKQIFDGYIDQFIDHSFIANPADTHLLEYIENLDSKIYAMSLHGEYCMTSAENIAKELYLTAELLFAESDTIQVYSAKLSETEHNHTIAYKDSIADKERLSFLTLKRDEIMTYFTGLDI